MTQKSKGHRAGEGAAKGVSRASGAVSEAGGEGLLSAAEALAFGGDIKSFIAGEREAWAMGLLRGLAQDPPQVLLLEGGTARERVWAAFYWAALLNCPGQPPTPSGPVRESLALIPRVPALPAVSGAPEHPCLTCPECLRFLGRGHRDLFFFDGTAGSIKIDPVRQLKSVLGTAPREAAKRVVIFAEAQALTEAAANALLKSLEEPRPDTVFALLAPQRERLLPTLVSRSWVLTLAWPDPGRAAEGEESEWSGRFAEFLSAGTGLFERTGTRGAMDAATAGTALTALQRCLAVAMIPGGDKADPLVRLFASLPPERQRMADEVIAEARDCLDYMVAPGMVLEWAATRFFLLLPH